MNTWNGRKNVSAGTVSFRLLAVLCFVPQYLSSGHRESFIHRNIYVYLCDLLSSFGPSGITWFTSAAYRLTRSRLRCLVTRTVKRSLPEMFCAFRRPAALLNRQPGVLIPPGPIRTHHRNRESPEPAGEFRPPYPTLGLSHYHRTRQS